MCRVLTYIGTSLAICLAGCSDGALKEKNNVLEKENAELKSKLEQAQKDEAGAKNALIYLAKAFASNTVHAGNHTITQKQWEDFKATFPNTLTATSPPKDPETQFLPPPPKDPEIPKEILTPAPQEPSQKIETSPAPKEKSGKVSEKQGKLFP